MRRVLRSFVADRRGATAVEFALLLGPFLLLIFGVFETGRALWVKDALQDVAVATARCAGVGQLECGGESVSAGDVAAFAREAASVRGLVLPDDRIAVDTGVECNGMPNAVMVRLEAEFQSVLPLYNLMDFTAEACFADWVGAERAARR